MATKNTPEPPEWWFRVRTRRAIFSLLEGLCDFCWVYRVQCPENDVGDNNINMCITIPSCEGLVSNSLQSLIPEVFGLAIIRCFFGAHTPSPALQARLKSDEPNPDPPSSNRCKRKRGAKACPSCRVEMSTDLPAFGFLR